MRDAVYLGSLLEFLRRRLLKNLFRFEAPYRYDIILIVKKTSLVLALPLALALAFAFAVTAIDKLFIELHDPILIWYHLHAIVVQESKIAR